MVIYLASPYSSPDPIIRKTRFLIAESFVSHCRKAMNLIIFSPIVYLHKLAEDNQWPYEAEPYHEFNMSMLRRSESMFQLELRGWEESKGMKVESNVAAILRIPVLRFNAEFECLNPEAADLKWVQ